MNWITKIVLMCCTGFLMTACVAKKEFLAVQTELERTNLQLESSRKELSVCGEEKVRLQSDLRNSENSLRLRQEQMDDLRVQLEDCKSQRDKQLDQVGDLTVLSQSANENIKETLSQLEGKDKYIRLLQAAKTKADSINLALAVNLKNVLKDGIEDEDVEIQVDKTVVFVNLSDKMLYESGSATLSNRANEVLGKIAQIVQSRPEVEVMVEGYTDNVPIKTNVMKDNWDLSVLRSTAVVRSLQWTHKVDPNRLIAAGRGQYNALTSNDTAEGRATNRRTRIIILPKLNQFYDLLNPNEVPE